MCGIAGIIDVNNNNIFSNRLKKMTDIIAHRGPDGEGQWISENGNVGFGHRRLSIIDLSHEADQPMHYLERYTLVFNGEIYNYVELKDILLAQGYSFKTASDTEVLLALYHRDKEACLQLLDGMFAFAIYDKEKNEIFIARDRFGEKPFFYSYKKNQYFLFGSEMKCLWAAGIEKKVDDKMLFNYLNNSFLHNPAHPGETFYENCKLLPHAHYIKISVKDLDINIRQYYDLSYKFTDNDISLKTAEEKLKGLFYESVTRRLRSDVPVGSSLSGGLDSSLVVSVIDELKKDSLQKQATFSAIFPGFERDEKKYMDLIIGKTNVAPHFVTPTDDEMIRDIDNLFFHQEEPYGSASIYIQYCVMKKAKEQQVTVLLDGQGADEILAGYHYYYPYYFDELRRKDKSELAKQKNAYLNLHADNFINKKMTGSVNSRIKSLAGSFTPALRKVYQTYKYAKDPFFNADFYHAHKSCRFQELEPHNTLNGILYYNTFQTGLQDLLRYSDRNSMAHGREVRLPFLYHKLVEFVMTLPPHFKIKDGWTKWIMRETFKNLLPAEITWRKDKIGYEPPQKNWMERPEIQNRITGAKEILADKKIISKATLDKKIIAESTSENKGKNWQFLMAGEMLKD